MRNEEGWVQEGQEIKRDEYKRGEKWRGMSKIRMRNEEGWVQEELEIKRDEYKRG